MTDTFTLAHFSDLHLPPIVGFQYRYWNAKRLFGYLNWQRKRRFVHERQTAEKLLEDAAGLRCDHTIITGDLANLGLPAEHEAALAWMQSKGTARDITVVPGNHDIYSSLHGDAGVARWAPFMAAEVETLAFPFVRRVGPLALIGLNSAIETPPFVAEGRLGPHQIEVLGGLLSSLEGEAIRVVMIHHPPAPGLTTPNRELKDAQHLVRVLERHGAELVLYGHNHRPSVTWVAGRSKAVPLVGVASGSARIARGSEPLAQYNLFTFFSGTGELRIRHAVRGLEKEDGEVTRLSESFLVPPA